MPLVHGRDITAEEVERIVGGEFRVQRFAGLCNAIVWATDRPALSQAAFTERVFAKDNGKDAEWVLNAPSIAPGQLVESGNVVYQYKIRDVYSRDRSSIVGKLTRDLHRAAAEVVRRAGHAVARYVLFTNIHLSLEERGRLEDAIRADFSGALNVTVVGAGQLSAFLNNVPHLRSAFFSANQFATWARAWEKHQGEMVGGFPPIVGRTALLESLVAAVDDIATKVVVAAGPSDIGKSRLILEATKHRPLDTVFALDPVSLKIQDLLSLTTQNDQNLLIVVDDPDPERMQELINAALGEGLKLLLTFPTAKEAEAVNYGRDARIKVFLIEGLNETGSEELLRAAGAKFDYSTQYWVVDHAGGNPGILLVAAAIGQELRTQGLDFRKQIGESLEIRARRIVGDAGLSALQILSIMTAVGHSEHAESELATICEIFGQVTVNQVLNAARALSGTGFLRVRGNYFEIVPPIFAAYLAEAAFHGRSKELAQLFRRLPPLARPRLLRRIRQLRTPTVERFWKELFDKEGLLSSFDSALGEAELLHLVAPAVPKKVATLILDGLQKKSLDDRLQISGSTRRELSWTLDHLLFRSETSRLALHALFLLAEAENENFGNNATGVFAECFISQHPQLPLSLHERLELLTQLRLSATRSEQLMIIVKAAASAFNLYGAITLRRSDGAEPLDPAATISNDDLNAYVGGLLLLLRDLMKISDARVSSAAGEALVEALGTYSVRLNFDHGTAMLKELSQDIICRRVPIQLETYVQALHLASRVADRPDIKPEVRNRFQNLVNEIDTGDYSTKLRRWVGSWEHGEEEEDENGQTMFHGDRQIKLLAEEAAQNPKVLDHNLLPWLLTPEAKRASQYFYWMGKADREKHWQPQLEKCGTEKSGADAFGAYFGGIASFDPAGVEERLDQLVEAGLTRGDALLAATRYLPGSKGAITRIISLIQSKRLDPVLAEKLLMAGGWMNPLTSEEASELLQFIAGPKRERAELVIDFLAMWVHSKKSIEDSLETLAWECLEAAPTGGQAWDFDMVAASLAQRNTDRAFNLLELLLTLPGKRKSWEPLDRHSGNRFWTTLWSVDSIRCLSTLMSVAQENPLTAWKISWHLPDILNLERDKELLLEFASKSEKHAEFVSGLITAARPHFWPIAVGLLNLHPSSEHIRHNIAAAAEHMNQVVTGPSSAHHEACALAVEEAIKSENPNPAAKASLLRVAAALRQRANAERIQEADEAVNF